MASVAQIQANRSNARKSTGPRTPQGKAAASQNAVKHGLLAEQVVIHGEDPAQFDLYREGMLAELAPEGAVEAMLAERAVTWPGGCGGPSGSKAPSSPPSTARTPTTWCSGPSMGCRSNPVRARTTWSWARW